MSVRQRFKPVEKMSPDERLAELARILARGLSRLKATEKEVWLSGEKCAEIRLDALSFSAKRGSV